MSGIGSAAATNLRVRCTSPFGVFLFPLPERDSGRLPLQCVVEGAVEPWRRPPLDSQLGSPQLPCRGPEGQLLSSRQPWVPHLKRHIGNYRSIKGPTAHGALCVLILSFCGRFPQLAFGVAGVGDGTGETRQVPRLKMLCAEVKGSQACGVLRTRCSGCHGK